MADSEMQDVRVAANAVSEIQTHYIRIRKIIPIPGLFKPIRYADYSLALNACKTLLDKIQIKLAELKNSNSMPQEVLAFTVVLDDFSTALSASIQLLKDICDRFAEKIEGGREYTRVAYDRDFENYQQSIQHYLGFGMQLDQLREPAWRCWVRGK
jgi:hypothetical protein